MRNDRRAPRILRFYFGVAKYLLIAMPLMAVGLILGAYITDIYLAQEDCTFTEIVFGFLGTAVRWYAGVLIAVIIAMHRVIAWRPPPGG